MEWHERSDLTDEAWLEKICATEEPNQFPDCSIVELPMQIVIYQGGVLVKFSTPTEGILLSKEQGIMLGNMIRIMAERLPD